MILFNSKKEDYKKPFGAILIGEEVQFRIRASGVRKATEAYLMMAKDGEEPYYITYSKDEIIQGGESVEWVQQFTFHWEGPFSGLFFYGFKVIREDGGIEFSGQSQITVYEKNECEVPAFLQGGLMYQIFPDRFARSRDFDWKQMEKKGRESKAGRPFFLHREWGEEPHTGPDENGVVWNSDFFGGSLKGIEERLDYLAELGVTVLYLNPIFRAFSNHRYDTGDYGTIDPLLGTKEDFRQLCVSAGARGIRVIFDGVFNHTGSDSLYFNKYGTYGPGGAYQSKESPYYPWYGFSQYPDKYDSWWGIDTLPAVDETEETYLDHMLRQRDSIVRRWLDNGASGVRIDVADELPDLFLDELRRTVKDVDPQAAIIGEVWEDASNKLSYGRRRRYFQGKQLDSVMNYPLKEGIIAYIGRDGDAEKFAELVDCLWENYPKEVFYSLMNILGTHDTERIFTVFLKCCSDIANCGDRAMRKLFLAVLLWAFMPGIPCIYYGDELGMEGERDPCNRRCFDPDQAKQEVKDFYKIVLEFRARIPELQGMEGRFCPIQAEGGLYAFARMGVNARLIIAVNGAREDCATAELNVALRKGEKISDFLAAGNVEVLDEEGKLNVRIPSWSGIVVYLNGDTEN